MTKDKDTQILKTKDYDKFQVYTFNRGINEQLVKKIMASITKIGYMPGKPVIVDKDFAIIDGQHRFTACQRLGIDIYYMITKINPEEAIVELNAQQVQWKMSDYIHLWADKGVKCYEHLLDFEERRKLGITNSIYILFNKSVDKTDVVKIKAGFKFSINANAEKIAAFILSCEIVPYYKSSYFIKAVVKLYKIATADQLEKVKNGLISLPQQPSTVAYMAAFENIVNRGVHAKNRVSFK